MFIQRFILALGCIFLTLSLLAEEPTESERERVQEIVEMLHSNPEVIDGLYDNLLRYLAEKQAYGVIDDADLAWLADNPLHPRMGAEQPQLTIINFTDYNCPFCKRLEPVLEQILQEYPQVQVVNIYLPMRQQRVDGLDTNSALYATQVWRAAADKYLEVHARLMNHPTNHSSRSLEQIARDTDTEAQLLADDTVSEVIERNLQTFRRLGFRGTPTLLVGDEAVPGFMPYERLQPMVEQALSKQAQRESGE